jgi:hypothetical protein
MVCDAAQAQQTLRVKQFTTPPSNPDGQTWANAFPSLEAALLAAGAGDTIWIAGSGSSPYKPLLTPSQWGSGAKLRVVTVETDQIVIRGGYPTQGSDSGRNLVAFPTVFSGDILGNDVLVGTPASTPVSPFDASFNDNSANVFHFTGDLEEVLVDGLTIEAAHNINWQPPVTYATFGLGGAARLSSATPGRFASVVFQNCRFVRNWAAKFGAGVFAAAAGTTAPGGGPAPVTTEFYPSAITIRTSEFRLNRVFAGGENAGGGDAGGAVALGLGRFDAAGSLFADGEANTFGGGIFVSGPTAFRLVNCTVTNNEANAGAGAGIAFEWFASQLEPDPDDYVIENSILVGNRAKGTGSSVFDDQIFIGDDAQGGQPYTLSYSIVTDVLPDAGVGNEAVTGSGPFFFVDESTGGEFTVASLVRDDRIVPSYSRCRGPIDRGNPDEMVLPLDEFDADDDQNTTELLPDLDRTVRIQPGYAEYPGCVDIGAYEAATLELDPLTCWSDLTVDGAVDASDLAVLLGAWGTLGTCLCGDVDGDGVIGASDLALLLGDWGACDAGGMAIAAGGEHQSSEGLSESLPVTPCVLAAVHGFATLDAFAAWLADQDPLVREAVLSTLGGGS